MGWRPGWAKEGKGEGKGARCPLPVSLWHVSELPSIPATQNGAVPAAALKLLRTCSRIFLSFPKWFLSGVFSHTANRDQ